MSVKELQLIVGNKWFIKINEWPKDERIIFDTVFLILQNQSIWPMKIILFYIGKYKVASKTIFFL